MGYLQPPPAPRPPSHANTGTESHAGASGHDIALTPRQLHRKAMMSHSLNSCVVTQLPRVHSEDLLLPPYTTQQVPLLRGLLFRLARARGPWSGRVVLTPCQKGRGAGPGWEGQEPNKQF